MNVVQLRTTAVCSSCSRLRVEVVSCPTASIGGLHGRSAPTLNSAGGIRRMSSRPTATSSRYVSIEAGRTTHARSRQGGTAGLHGLHPRGLHGTQSGAAPFSYSPDDVWRVDKTLAEPMFDSWHVELKPIPEDRVGGRGGTTGERIAKSAGAALLFPTRSSGGCDGSSQPRERGAVLHTELVYKV